MAGLYKYAGLLVKTALAEDVGAGDITTEAIVPKGMTGTCRIVADEKMVLAGLFVAEMVFTEMDSKIKFKAKHKDGDMVLKGEEIAVIKGSLSSLLTAERVALNFLQRLSGISTLTFEFVSKVKGTGAKVLDTRKTTPCMRSLEKYAVKVGGGVNHRTGLYDYILIKDNHIKAAGTLAEAVESVDKCYGGGAPVEVEVTNLKEVKEAIKSRADIIMLDNMDTTKIKRAIEVIDDCALVEVSGGVNLKTIKGIAACGVDFISVGALTHSAPSVDISMDVVIDARKTKRRG
ncbi:MAG: carboxylating nicotinate-nucleotide diphosphorylase [Proteobacteria bacterium]|nr:carboxylating nicotinate-nucleotide diphosphorylase [Pseudomonadota bacterium]